MQRCGLVPCGGGISGLEHSCADTKAGRLELIKNDLIRIEQMGFNTIRLVGLAAIIRGSNAPAPVINGQLTSGWIAKEKTAIPCNCLEMIHNMSLMSQEDYNRNFNLIQLVIDIIKTNNLKLKIILLSGDIYDNDPVSNFNNYNIYCTGIA